MTKKHHSTWLARPLQTLTMGTLLLSPVAHSQSVSQSQNQAMQSQIQMMQGQVQALVARVKSLEDQAQLASGDSGDDKQSKAIERRLEALEREEAKLDAEESAHQGAKTGDKPGLSTTVVAPFTVVDKEGKTVVRIAAKDSNSLGGIFVFDATGQAVAQVGMTRSGGLLALMNSKSGAKEPDILLGVSSDGPKLQIQDGGKKQFALDKESLAFYGDGDSVLSLFGTKKRVKGYLELNDMNGIMVEAGVLDSHKGYVMANPWRPSPDVRGDPSVLKGGGK
jgi:hypothetical protein